ncbi:MAG TPA: AlkA N-terminal domain-containing protein [Xanthobacteraceae bacterium]
MVDDSLTAVEEVPGLSRTAMHRARHSRDARFDGRFFISATTTDIYCRPICPSPRARDRDVRYYPSAAAAAAAGYRPCRRCRPETAPGSPAWSGTMAVVRRALRLIDQGALDDSTIESFAQRVGIGARHLSRLFQRHLGASPIAVAQTRRLNFATHLLRATQLPVTQVALASGFRSVRRFNAVFKEVYRCAPSEERRQQRDCPDMASGNDIVLRLSFRPPYDWEYLLAFLAQRALAGVEQVIDGKYLRTVVTDAGAAWIAVRHLADVKVLELRIGGAGASDLMRLAATARRAFDLTGDPSEVNAVLKPDPLLGRLVRSRPGLRIPGAWDPFECAVRAVLGQQTSAAGGRLVGRLLCLLGTPAPKNPFGLTYVFPSPRSIASADLSSIGVVRSRAAALRALAVAVRDGDIQFDAPIDETMRTLMAIPGISEWTAEYVALRALEEPDSFPAADLELRRHVSASGKLVSAADLKRRAEAWRPWRGYAAVHLWASAD